MVLDQRTVCLDEAVTSRLLHGVGHALPDDVQILVEHVAERKRCEIAWTHIARRIDIEMLGVCFTYRDRGDGNRLKYKRLEAVEFIQRFLTHVLPSGFSRIRHYGLLANRSKQRSLKQCRMLLGEAPVLTDGEPSRTVADWMQVLLGLDITCCPKCRGPLHRESLPRVEHPRVQPSIPNCRDP